MSSRAWLVAVLAVLGGCTLSPTTPYDGGGSGVPSWEDAASAGDAAFDDATLDASAPLDGGASLDAGRDASEPPDALADADTDAGLPADASEDGGQGEDAALDLDAEILTDAAPVDTGVEPEDSGAAPVDSGVERNEAGVSFDGAAPIDGGRADAAPAADSGVAMDSGTPVDSGVVFDAGPPDSGVVALVIELNGGGTVSGPGILCSGALCGGNYPPGTMLTLSAIPQGGWGFSDWSGAPGCEATTCSVTLTADLTLEARFEDGLFSYYPLDADTNDASGNGRHVAGQSGAITTVAGQVNAARRFTAPSWYRIPDAQALEGTAVATFCAWLAPGTTSSSEQVVLRKLDVLQLALTHDGTTRAVRAELVQPGSLGGLVRTSVSAPLPADPWVHVCTRFCPGLLGGLTPSVQLFVDGTGGNPVAGGLATTLNSNNADFYAGGCNGCTAAQSFGGALDEVKVWSRCLTPEQIAAETARR